MTIPQMVPQMDANARLSNDHNVTLNDNWTNDPIRYAKIKIPKNTKSVCFMIYLFLLYKDMN
jgi:hypothetical protein